MWLSICVCVCVFHATNENVDIIHMKPKNKLKHNTQARARIQR